MECLCGLGGVCVGCVVLVWLVWCFCRLCGAYVGCVVVCGLLWRVV